ncbi:dGTPase [Parabacteroides sp. PF5-5]|uniref:dGTP triphosphohydrolase n=1 Tax=unclassified Parabacteroides TaxID=2649774 RepID=UPI0024736A84|nr:MULTISPECIES: dNTP triphosphohydrolase [unclassified Parabacteroides]MDH6306965.1 dGTPase [Parabacteroides sp. PH5-39]MDH6317839.1 dGTPase [Parabacteroides sp. PF5-13]MDH6321570.1 dGTPase [Parabacteroides sp. PH5-13]MDH6325354.1 dGTPase [Parabacteroides sp. PH5-8]MDH6329025.1 dGTPase [Parabacteroides sp. PH5-41]
MNWAQLLSGKRLGMEDYHERKHERTDFQRDYDRLIFSSPFRRLQNKTQVFPLPGSIFVHNRLTHSLEVSCVGRSLGNNVTKGLMKKYPGEEISFQEIGSIVSAACLAHDMGNPPFGHSGERAISGYFSEGNGKELEAQVREEGGRWEDFLHFEGNANAMRLLTHQFIGRRKGGFALTYCTLASIVKYPYSSVLSEKGGKFGFFQSEEETYHRIATELGIQVRDAEPVRYIRYPLVYLVEAADDICYQVMDIEDAHKLRILTSEETIGLLLGFFEGDKLNRINEVMHKVDDINEQIAYLRSGIIGLLVDECSRVFLENEEQILNGTFKSTLIEEINDHAKQAYKACSKVAYTKIYRAKEVLDIELAGFHIFSQLIDSFTDAVINPGSAYSRLLLQRVPEQYDTNAPTTYGKIQCVLDYISGMTDIYALDIYRKITGMSLPAV